MDIPMVKISAAIITFNEEKNIERCIKSLIDVVDEIVVVDSFSTDRTEEICKKYDVTFIQNPFAGHIQQKNFALEKATYDHVLSLDADEALDETLKGEILKVKDNFTADGYYFNRLTNYVDHWVKNCGWYPDRKLRLLNKNLGKWGGVNPHDLIIMNEGSTTQYLRGDLLHYSYDSITDHVNQTNKFTTIAAKAAYSQGKRSSAFKIVSRPILKFLKDYFLKKGFLDGQYGLIICSINALYALLKYSKIKELQDGKSID
ncbi:glycosyltransferase family 2 protein [Halobacteriovorax sp. GB3]|uniref:glycosyltransferase family 2 protein n=1 Tax=Halobacteriovorax sp. GB3 TaxID=2719615 RepID=UPI00236230D7|nr:glycosyltransferase family 2 protein [Halobacteriovorax sp. GB3]MDD0852564.1 glycosyltransferase family 2 protein [Halobacteriovorax sp. GB3]